jgi:hypothetical protein
MRASRYSLFIETRDTFPYSWAPQVYIINDRFPLHKDLLEQKHIEYASSSGLHLYEFVESPFYHPN